MTFSDAVTYWRYRLIPDHIIGEVLAKRWIDNAIPFLTLVIVMIGFGSAMPDFFGIGGLETLTRQLGEFGLVCIAMMIVMLAGGIDLSVGSNYALANIIALALLNVYGLPVWAAFIATLGAGALVGLLNGVLIGYLRLRAFLTTLVTLIIVRAIVDMLLLRLAVKISAGMVDSDLWDYLGEGTVFGIPFGFLLFLVIALAAHIMLSRTRPGWQLMAVGGMRRSAHNVGIPVRRTVCLTYVASGILVSLAGFFFAARLGGAGSDTGFGLEITALTAAVLGGNSLGGGRGSAAKAVFGAVITLIIVNGLVRLGASRGANSFVLGFILLLAVAIDVRWLRNRHKVLAKVYVSPVFKNLPKTFGTERNSSSPFALNDKLREVSLIGLGDIDGPEDVILDEDDHLYAGTRTGDIVRFLAPDYQQQEIFAHVGGRPLGMAFAKDGALLCCIGGMGLYRVGRDREVTKLTDETNRTTLSVIDDSRLKLADDLDIAPDGRVFFSEATVRYEMHEWPVDSLESRGNGRIICYDPNTGTTKTVLRNLLFPNGICMTGDGVSFMFAETWACTISRYYFDGPKAGTVEKLIPNLPGYPDNINRASDGTYWLALVGMRTPSMDLALKMPGFRRRMARRVAPDEWLFPNINTGCVLRFDEQGNIHDVMWDLGGENHPMITSMREHKGHLYIGGILNNRIGRLALKGANTSWTGPNSYWGRA